MIEVHLISLKYNKLYNILYYIYTILMKNIIHSQYKYIKKFSKLFPYGYPAYIE